MNREPTLVLPFPFMAVESKNSVAAKYVFCLFLTDLSVKSIKFSENWPDYKIWTLPTTSIFAGF
jgi:hypothetical protein